MSTIEEITEIVMQEVGSGKQPALTTEQAHAKLELAKTATNLADQSKALLAILGNYPQIISDKTIKAGMAKFEVTLRLVQAINRKNAPNGVEARKEQIAELYDKAVKNFQNV